MTETRFLCHDTLENLGMLDVVKSLLKYVGLENFMAKGAHTYRRYTLEFLSTLTLSGESNKTPKITFRLKGKPHSLTYAGLRKAFGIKEMSKVAYKGLGKEAETQWWKELTGLDTNEKQDVGDDEVPLMDKYLLDIPCLIQAKLLRPRLVEGTYFWWRGPKNYPYLKMPPSEDEPLAYGEVTEDFFVRPDPDIDPLMDGEDGSDDEGSDELSGGSKTHEDAEGSGNGNGDGDRSGNDTTATRSVATSVATYDQVWMKEVDAWRKEVDVRQVRTDGKLAALSNILLETHELVRSLNNKGVLIPLCGFTTTPTSSIHQQSGISSISPSMVPLHSLSLFPPPTTLLFSPPHLPILPFPHFHKPSSRRFTPTSLQNDAFNPSQPQPQPPRTLFPGGYKRPEIKVPNIVLQLTPQDILLNATPNLDFIDAALVNQVGIVIIGDADIAGGGAKLYEAACLLKSLIRDRAFLLVLDRVDIAAAVNATGLPPIVARNTLMGSKSESVYLPVIGKMVQTVNAAIFACDSEGADFLIFNSPVEQHTDILRESINQKIEIPVFYQSSFFKNDGFFNKVPMKIMPAASGVVTTLEELMSNGDLLGKLVYNIPAVNDTSPKEIANFSKKNMLNTTNGLGGNLGFDSFVKLEDSEAQFIKKERRVLVAAANIIEKAAPLMEEISLLNDAISQLDEPFLLVIVGEFNSGKSTFINALLGGKFLKDGVVPTTNEITFLRYTEVVTQQQKSFERHPDGRYICYLPSKILKKMIVVDTPGTNVILQRQQRLTEEFVPRADLLLFVLSADRPLTESEVWLDSPPTRSLSYCSLMIWVILKLSCSFVNV
ncbi:hypothetical protein KSS87_007131 [Heliosperma pusillum]|nr:hypothetical protein KSS87_007131 [Heliosperma pusillum]